MDTDSTTDSAKNNVEDGHGDTDNPADNPQQDETPSEPDAPPLEYIKLFEKQGNQWKEMTGKRERQIWKVGIARRRFHVRDHPTSVRRLLLRIIFNAGPALFPDRFAHWAVYICPVDALSEDSSYSMLVLSPSKRHRSPLALSQAANLYWPSKIGPFGYEKSDELEEVEACFAREELGRIANMFRDICVIGGIKYDPFNLHSQLFATALYNFFRFHAVGPEGKGCPPFDVDLFKTSTAALNQAYLLVLSKRHIRNLLLRILLSHNVNQVLLQGSFLNSPFQLLFEWMSLLIFPAPQVLHSIAALVIPPEFAVAFWGSLTDLLNSKFATLVCYTVVSPFLIRCCYIIILTRTSTVLSFLETIMVYPFTAKHKNASQFTIIVGFILFWYIGIPPPKPLLYAVSVVELFELSRPIALAAPWASNAWNRAFLTRGLLQAGFESRLSSWYVGEHRCGHGHDLAQRSSKPTSGASGLKQRLKNLNYVADKVFSRIIIVGLIIIIYIHSPISFERYSWNGRGYGGRFEL
ncbi:unnamed protein product [Periconia digitata]|uniref:Uncharacterized protein n=1 Tax=Periconia digitata TaxID=1303443 RepID=A0A9W4XWW6_9PLEO|nr:unnamed protein product [Periconia digitata]